MLWQLTQVSYEYFRTLRVRMISRSCPLASMERRKLLVMVVFLYASYFSAVSGLRAFTSTDLQIEGRRVEQVVESLSEEDSEDSENDADPVVLETAVVGIVLFLIVLTIIFEAVKEYIFEAADKNLKPVIEALFGEMAVLGFVSGVSFIATEAGVFSALSEKFFGDDEHLLHLFEFLHYMLFLVMVFFVVSVLILVKEALIIEERWWLLDRACKDGPYIQRVRALAMENRKTVKNWAPIQFKTICAREDWKHFADDLIVFDGIRQDFLLEREVEEPFDPIQTDCGVEENFSFGRYLSICLGHTLEHIVEVQSITWFCFAGMTLCYYCLVRLVNCDTTVFAWAWASSGWLLFFFGSVFDHHISGVLRAFIVSGESSNSESASEHDSLVPKTLPKWCSVDLDFYMATRTTWQKWLNETQIPNRRDTLYWGERKGPELYLVILQFKLVFVSAYFALLCLNLLPFVWQNEDRLLFAVYVAYGLTPAFLFRMSVRESIANMTISCSIGDHRRPQVIAQVFREEKTEQLIRSLLVVEKIHRATAVSSRLSQTINLRDTDVFNSLISDEELDEMDRVEHQSGRITASTRTESNRQLDSTETDAVTRIFSSFDKSGDGAIQSSEFGSLMAALGIPLNAGRLEAMIEDLDCDGDGEISLEEFLEFYKSSLSSSRPHENDGSDLEAASNNSSSEEVDFHELGRFMFLLFDYDRSGDVTLSEFKQVLDTLQVGFTIDEVGDLVKELDEDNRGSLREENFVELLEKHHYLFTERPLPAIE